MIKKETAEKLSHMESIGKGILALWAAKCNGKKAFLEKLEEIKPLFATGKDADWVQQCHKLSCQYLAGFEPARDAVWKMLQDVYQENVADFMQYCRDIYLAIQKLEDTTVFNRALNALYSFRFIGGLSDETIAGLNRLAIEALRTIPDYGYKPEEDDWFEEKVFEGRIPYVGEREIRLIEAELIAEANEYLAQTVRKKR